MFDDVTPFPAGLGEAGCRAYVPHGPGGQPTHCPARVEWTGVVLRRRDRERPVQVWQVFACGEHLHGMTARRRLLDRDRQRLDELRAGAARVRARTPPFRQPQPLAVGEAALDLFAAAQRWEQAHPAG